MDTEEKPPENLLPARVGAIGAGASPRAIVPTDVESVFRLAKIVAMSGLHPSDLDTPEKICVALMTGLEVGLPPMAAMQSIAVINGRPCIWGDGAMALVRGSGLLEDFNEWLEDEGDGAKMTAYCTVKRMGMKPVTHKFSVADAKAANLWNNSKKDPWIKYPKRMLAMRPRSWCLRDCFSDVLKGLRVAEEVRDTDYRDITPGVKPVNALQEDEDAPQPVSGEVIDPERKPRTEAFVKTEPPENYAQWARDIPHDPETGEIEDDGITRGEVPSEDDMTRGPTAEEARETIADQDGQTGLGLDVPDANKIKVNLIKGVKACLTMRDLNAWKADNVEALKDRDVRKAASDRAFEIEEGEMKL